MIPAKVKDFIAEAAAQIGIPEDDLANMISFYFKETRRTLSRLENVQVVLRGLGVMKIKGWDIDKEIEKLQKRITLTKDPDGIKELEKQVEIYQQAKKKWDAQMELKKKAAELKKNYYTKKATNNEVDRKSTTGLEE
jgi:hypothetical protein